MHLPLVSVICLCYNHERFVHEAIASVLNQTFTNIQIIIVDDLSTDQSATVIQKIIDKNPLVNFIQLKENHGICKAFNKALKLATGEYIIDFATDDVMLPDKIAQQVDFFQTLDKSYGVIFTDAVYINAKGEFIHNHYDYLFRNKLLKYIPEGDVYSKILSIYFVASPTMMVRREVFESLAGYDENLSYEDFDFWVRSSRKYKYAFLNKVLVKIRRTTNSMSRGWYTPGDPQLHSTYIICKKAEQLIQTQADKDALVIRARYELRQSIFSENNNESKLFYELLHNLSAVRKLDRITYSLRNLPLPLSLLRRWYHRIRFNTL